MQSQKYTRLPGTKNQGVDYEIEISALLALRCLLPENNIQDFYIAQNVKDPLVGKFDDIILSVLHNDAHRNSVYCMQLKHFGEAERKRKITYDSFLKQDTKNQKSPFNIEKYYRSVKNATQNSSSNKDQSLFNEGKSSKHFHYVIFTNKNKDDSEEKFIQETDKSVFQLLNCGGSAFRFERFGFASATSGKLVSIENDFLDRFTVFCNQIDEECLDGSLQNAVCALFDSLDKNRAENVTNKFKNYIQAWMDGRYGGDRTLTRPEILYKLAEFIVTPHVHFCSFENLIESDSAIADTWCQISKSYGAILIEENAVSVAIESLIHSEIASALLKRSGTNDWNRSFTAADKDSFFSNKDCDKSLRQKCNERFEDGKITLKNLLFLLWSENKVAVILRGIDSTNIGPVLQLLNAIGSCRMILLVGDDFKSNFAAFKRTTRLQRFTDLTADSQEMLLRQKIKFQARETLLGDVFWYEDIQSLLSTAHILQILTRGFSIGGGDDFPALPNIFIDRHLECVFVDASFFDYADVLRVFCDSKDTFLQYVKWSGMQTSESVTHYAENDTLLFVTILPTRLLHKSHNYLKNNLSENASQQDIDENVSKNVNVKVYELTRTGRYAFRVKSMQKSLSAVLNIILVENHDDFVQFLNSNDVKFEPSEIYTADNLPNKKHLPLNCKYVLTRKEINIQAFKNLYTTKLEINYFRLRKSGNENYLEWISTIGNCSKLRKFRSAHQTCCNYDVANCFQNGNLNVITAAPGMGKSILVDYLCTNCPSNFWAIRVNLNNHISYFNADQFSTQDVEKHLKHFARYSLLSPFERSIFDLYFKYRMIFVFFDSFDEIAPIYEKIAGSLAQVIVEHDFKLLITTRPVKQSFLEDKLNVIARYIRPFSAEDQFLFISRYFKSHIRNCDSKVDSFVKTLLEVGLSGMSAWDKKFVEIPLQIYMISQIYLEQCAKFCDGEFDIFPKIDSLFIYDRFIDFKVKHLQVKEKFETVSALNNFILYKNRSIKYHQLCALVVVFPHYKLTTESLQFLNEVKEGSDKLGLIENVVNDNCPVFIHRTFAEYFAALYLANNYSENAEVKLLLEIVCCDSVYDIVRNIFDRLLAKDCEAHLAVLNNDVPTLKDIIANRGAYKHVDEGGRNILHIASSWDIRHSVPNYEAMNKMGSHKNMTVLFLYSKGMYNSLRQEFTNRDLLKLIINSACQSGENYTKDSIFKSVPLEYAIRTRSLRVVDILLNIEYKANKNFKTVQDILALLFEYKTKVSDTEKTAAIYDHIQLTYICCMYDYPNIFAALMRLKPKLLNLNNIKFGVNKLSILHFATIHNSKKIVAQLINKQNFLSSIFTTSAADTSSKSGWTPLMLACRYGHADLTNMLIKASADVNTMTKSGWFPLLLASRYNHLEIVCLLIASSVKIDATDKSNWTALMKASTVGNTDIVKALIAAKSDVNMANEDGETALILSAQGGFTDVVKLLIEASANVNAKERKGMSALLIAARFGQTDVVKLFIATPSTDLNSKDIEGCTALMKASFHGNQRIVKILLESPAVDVMAVDEHGGTALMQASQRGHTNIVRMLLKANASVNAKGKSGWCSLMTASWCGYLETVKTLIFSGADVNALSCDGWSSLMIASQEGHKDVVQLLLHHEADVNVVNSNGNTAMHLAATNGHDDVIAMLEEHGAASCCCETLMDVTRTSSNIHEYLDVKKRRFVK